MSSAPNQICAEFASIEAITPAGTWVTLRPSLIENPKLFAELQHLEAANVALVTEWVDARESGDSVVLRLRLTDADRLFEFTLATDCERHEPAARLRSQEQLEALSQVAGFTLSCEHDPTPGLDQLEHVEFSFRAQPLH